MSHYTDRPTDEALAYMLRSNMSAEAIAGAFAKEPATVRQWVQDMERRKARAIVEPPRQPNAIELEVTRRLKGRADAVANWNDSLVSASERLNEVLSTSLDQFEPRDRIAVGRLSLSVLELGGVAEPVPEEEEHEDFEDTLDAIRNAVATAKRVIH